MDKIAFRRGFLLGLASYGIGPEEFGQLIMEKQASVKRAFSVGNLLDIPAAGLIGVPVGAGLLMAHHNASSDAKSLYNRARVRYNPINDVSNELAQATRRLQAVRAKRQSQQEPARVQPAASPDPFLRSLPAA